MAKPLGLLCLGMLSLASCGILFPLKLDMDVTGYPLNDLASEIGMLKTSYVDHIEGRADFAIRVDGETMKGEAFTIDDGQTAWGTVST